MDRISAQDRYIASTFMQSLRDADRVVVERGNALEKMDAHYFLAKDVMNALVLKHQKLEDLIEDKEAECRHLRGDVNMIKAKLYEAEQEGLKKAANRIDKFIRSCRFGVSEYIKGQDDCAMYLRNEILAMTEKENTND